MTILPCQDEKPCILSGCTYLVLALEPYPHNHYAMSTTSNSYYQYSELPPPSAPDPTKLNLPLLVNHSWPPKSPQKPLVGN